MKLKEGDVFSIKVNENKNGYGQIVKVPNRNNFIIVVFEYLWDSTDTPDLKGIINTPILFMGYTLDAKLYHKHWAIVGNYQENLINIDLPCYKLGTPPDDIFIVDFSGEKIRECTKKEFKSLSYQKVIAPVRYEMALKAFHGYGDWREDFEELKIGNLLKGKQLISPS